MDYFKISPGIEEYTKSQFLINFRKTAQRFPNIDFSDSLSRNQIKSKSWLINEMITAFGRDYENIFVLCGWHGVLPAMIADNPNINFKTLRSIDIDPSCEKIADSMNNELFKNKWRFKAFTADILNLSYQQISLTTEGNKKQINEKADLIINTSCEHIADYKKWISLLSKGQKVILQSNNYDLHAQHTNCSDSLDDFINQSNLTEIIYKSTLPFDDYDRYMLIGQV